MAITPVCGRSESFRRLAREAPLRTVAGCCNFNGGHSADGYLFTFPNVMPYVVGRRLTLWRRTLNEARNGRHVVGPPRAAG